MSKTQFLIVIFLTSEKHYIDKISNIEDFKTTKIDEEVADKLLKQYL